MSLRALPKDLCTSSHRQVPRPPLLPRTGGTGNKTNLPGPSGLSGLLAIAQRQIRQKRRLHHWMHARQLSLCISETDLQEKIHCFAALGWGSLQSVQTAEATKPSKRHLADLMKGLVSTRSELNKLGDPVGVLNANAYLLCLAARVRLIKSDPHQNRIDNQNHR